MRLFLVSFLFFYSAYTQAATVYLPMPEGATLANGTDVHFRYPMSSNDYEAAFPRQTSIPTSKGRMPVTVQHQMNPNVGKVGKAAANFAKRVGPLATGIAVAQLLCDLSDVCVSPDNPDSFQKRESPEYSDDYPEQTPQYGWGDNSSPPLFPTPHAAAEDFIITHFVCQTNTCAVGVMTEDTETQKRYRLVVNGENNGQFYINRFAGCANGYALQGLYCVNTALASYRPMLPSDWEAAESPLSVPEMIPPLVQAGEPIPVDVPVLQPKEIVAERESETVRDGNGDATGTRTTERTVKIEPLPNPSPTSANSPAKITETTITTTTNITNNTTNSTTTVNDSLPDEPPPEEEDTDIEFDDVSSEELQNHEIQSNFSPVDFGGSASCPSDPVANLSVGSFTLPFHYACDFAGLIRFVILILAAIGAAYIIAGTRSGTD